MITINVTFTDQEHKKLKKAKKASPYQTWHEFIFRMCSKGYSVHRQKRGLTDGRA